MREFEDRWIVRDFKDGDYQGVLDVWIKTGLTRPERGDNLEIIKQTLRQGGKLFILEDSIEGQIVGTSWITNDGRRLHLQYFGILPQYQGQGLSHYLMIESLRFARETGLQIKLEVHRDNTVAKNLYIKWGFKHLGPYEIYILRDVKNIKV